MSNVSTVRQNGFIETVVDAYNRHYNLVIKPDDIWVAILTQFNIYVNAHAEELRSHFVAHEGKKELIVQNVGTRYTVDHGKVAVSFTTKIQENVIDPDLQSWILPDFTTTTFNDTIICSVLMMSTLKSYFSYTSMLCCGIPSVTLLGEKSDWEKIVARLGKLETFGEEPAAWASLLRPVLMRFVDAFDGNYHPDFWPNICHIMNGSGMSYLSGWLTSFCVWNRQGKWVGPKIPVPDPEMTSGGTLPQIPKLHKLNMYSLPPAVCDVDVKLDDNGVVFDCVMVAGHVGNVTLGASRDTLGMVPAWFMAIKEKKAE
ncbi:hypothetical protein BJ165DRAFT_1352817 [Panaeolus papilionaceus]|nr:hypothetical protein BJ165DRAFT_1352817 [Panaeolus papilionaceus]